MRSWILLLALLDAGSTALQDLDQAVCQAGEPCTLSSDTSHQYYWPSAPGRVGSYATSPYAGPGNVSSTLSWSWHHPKSRYETIVIGCVIDDQSCVYLSTHHAVMKFSPDGQVKWTYDSPHGWHSATPSLMDGAVYVTNTAGAMFALDMESGALRWTVNVSNEIGIDATGTGAHRGVFVASTHGLPTGGDMQVTALNGTDGAKLWSFAADSLLWNFMPFFTEDDRVIFQDQIGGVYCVGLADGKLVWKSGYQGSYTETWTDGTPLLGPNGIVYAVHMNGRQEELHAHQPGDLSAYSVKDGALAWRQSLPHPPNTQPVLVARRGGGGGFSVVMPIGAQAAFPYPFIAALAGIACSVLGLVMALFCELCCCACRTQHVCGSRQLAKRAICGMALGAMLGNVGLALAPIPILSDRSFPAELRAFDAETGVPQWRWAFPLYERRYCAGDLEGLGYRAGTMGKSNPVCLPTPFGAPAVDADGVIYVGYMDGKVYAISDSNDDGAIDSLAEVSTFDTGAGFNIPGSALAPSMLAIPSCDGLFVFRT